MSEGFERLSPRKAYALLRNMNVGRLKSTWLSVKGVKQYVIRPNK